MLNRKQVVAVAKDVLAQIKVKKFRVKTGIYLGVNLSQEEGAAINDLQDLMKIKKPCHVCARGALILSKANLYNNCPVEMSVWGNMPYIEDTAEALSSPDEGDAFPAKLTAMAETAFEGFTNGKNHEVGCHPSVEYLTAKEHAACLAFYKRYRKAEDRLVAIMRNIVKNEGRFIPKSV